MSTLRISLFGDVRIEHESWSQAVNVTHAVQALLAYLLLQPHHPQPRDVLADVFWSNRSQERARGCLNTALWRLRRVLEPEGTSPGTYLIASTNGDIGFNWESDYWLDVTTFEQAAQRALTRSIEHAQLEDVCNLEVAVNLYSGELLEGFYDDWALRERERVRHLYLNSLAYLMRFYQRRGLHEKGLENGRKILNIDPLREEIHRDMMQLYFESGQRTLAIQQYEICCELLDTELGIIPMDETQALYAKIAPESDRLRSTSVDTKTLPLVQHAVQQLHVTLRNLEKAHEQLQQLLKSIENLSGRDESIDHGAHR